MQPAASWQTVNASLSGVKSDRPNRAYAASTVGIHVFIPAAPHDASSLPSACTLLTVQAKPFSLMVGAGLKWVKEEVDSWITRSKGLSNQISLSGSSHHQGYGHFSRIPPRVHSPPFCPPQVLSALPCLPFANVLLTVSADHVPLISSWGCRIGQLLSAEPGF